MSARVTVIIVSWNARDLLQKCLPSVCATDWDNLEIVLADNGSTDGSAEWVEATFPQVRVIRHGSNLGFCAGNNRAIEQTSGDYVVLLNNDVEVPTDWLRPMVAEMEGDARIAAVQPKLLQFDDRTRFEYAGAAGGHLDRFGYPFARGRLFFDVERDLGQYDEAADVFWATGAAMMLRRSALAEVDLLDEQFEFHMEEIDLCWRLWSAGFRVRCVPASRAWHIGGGSLAQGNPRKTLYNFRNSLLMLYKNLPRGQWISVFPARVGLDAIAALRFVLGFEFANAWAVVRAYAQAHGMKGAYRQPEGGAPPSYGRSIVWDYFVRRRRTFSRLAREAFRISSGPAQETP